MPKDEDNPSPYMTRSECLSQRRPIRADITTIKKALVGEDLRGGIVKDCSDMKKDLKAVKKSINDANNKKEKKQELSLKWKLGLTVALIGAFSLIAVKIIEVVAGTL